MLRATTSLPQVLYAQLAIDDFVHGYGNYQDLCSRLGFSVAGILEKLRSELQVSYN